VWSYEIGRSIFSSPAVADGVLITASLDGSVYAFGARPTPVEGDR
jgi:outer membrane protein assembly factor BamB